MTLAENLIVLLVFITILVGSLSLGALVGDWFGKKRAERRCKRIKNFRDQSLKM